MLIRKFRRAALRGVVVIALVAGGLLAATPQASAGASCSFIGCSHTHNASQYSVFTAHNWCWGDDAQRPDSAISQCNSSSQLLWVSAGSVTPSGQDWDAFRVDGGWCYRGYWSNTYTGSYTDFTINRIGQGGVWVKTADYQHAWVTYQSVSSC
jgi:hypothetical protein